MEIINRYIYAIEKRLFGQGKKDIVKEIHSIIMDELEGKFGTKEVYEKQEIESVLQEMGHPRVVASRYRGDKEYLIGPELFPFYKMVTGIVCGAVLLGLFVSFIVGSFTADMSVGTVLRGFLQFLASTLSALLGAIGGSTVTFFIIERFTKFDKKSVDMNEAWKAADLPEIPQENERVKMAEPIITITFVVIWAVFINTFAINGTIPFLQNLGENITVVPIFNVQVVRQILPYWNIAIVITLIQQLIIFKNGRWQLGTRVLDIITSIIGIMVLGILLNLPMLLDFEYFITLTEGEFAIQSIEKFYYIALKVLMALTAIGVVVNTVKLFIKRVANKDAY